MDESLLVGPFLVIFWILIFLWIFTLHECNSFSLVCKFISSGIQLFASEFIRVTNMGYIVRPLTVHEI